jgi:hypothetical protein
VKEIRRHAPFVALVLMLQAAFCMFTLMTMGLGVLVSAALTLPILAVSVLVGTLWWFAVERWFGIGGGEG